MAGSISVLVAGVDCERFDLIEPNDIPDSLFSSLEDLLVFSPEEGWEEIMDIHESLLNAEGIFWVSMAAGGGGLLLKRFAALTSAAFWRSPSCLSFFSRSFSSFSALRLSFFLCFSPWSDQLGEMHISFEPFSLSLTSVLTFKG